MLYAYAWASGLIEFGKYVPDRALELVAGESETVKHKIHARARLARDNQNWLVPGVPEADSSEQKMRALLRFAHMLDVTGTAKH